MLEKSCVRVKLGNCNNWCSETQFSLDEWMTTVIGVTCIYSITIADLYICLFALERESAEALGSTSVVACYRLSRS